MIFYLPVAMLAFGLGGLVSFPWRVVYHASRGETVLFSLAGLCGSVFCLVYVWGMGAAGFFSLGSTSESCGGQAGGGRPGSLDTGLFPLRAVCGGGTGQSGSLIPFWVNPVLLVTALGVVGFVGSGLLRRGRGEATDDTTEPER